MVVAAAASDADAGDCTAGTDPATCNSKRGDDVAAVNLDTAFSCREQVLLYEGVPGINGDGNSRTMSLLDQEEIMNNSEFVFDKVSRYGENALDDQEMISRKMLHISANGDDGGWYIFVPRVECISEVKQLVSMQIVASKVEEAEYPEDAGHTIYIDLRGPHRLVDEEGRKYPENAPQSIHLHLLLPRESFVHEAVKEGFERVLNDGTKLTTLSMSPRVFLVDPILTVDECNELIDASSTTFQRSGETHYAPGFENYRTSLTGNTPRNSPVAQKLWRRVQLITALDPPSVEFPQLIKYETGVSWYKEHQVRICKLLMML